MPRSPRVNVVNYAYHILNRANHRQKIFFDDNDYAVFLKLIGKGFEKYGVRMLSYCLMPNHWHMVAIPEKDGALSKTMAWLGAIHTRRHNLKYKRVGQGHLYQGRFKSFLIESNEYLLWVCRYVERNPVRAGLSLTAKNWRWSSTLDRIGMNRDGNRPALAEMPVTIPKDWCTWVDSAQTALELEAIRHCIKKSRPYGSSIWSEKIVSDFGLVSTTRNQGRPKNRDK